MDTQEVTNGIIDVGVGKNDIKTIYSLYSKVYFLVAAFEKKARMRGIEVAGIKPEDKVLEVAVGTGHSFLELLRRVSRDNTVCGLDLTPAMLEKTRRLAMAKGYSNFDFREGDARSLPFPDEAFNVVYNSYMMDLIPTGEFPVVLREYHRVLKKDGRLILVNLSKNNQEPILWEKLYRVNPYILGGCRPVMMEPFMRETGFREIQREFRPSLLLPTEIVTALK